MMVGLSKRPPALVGGGWDVALTVDELMMLDDG